jgi:catechol 2,3-dioxygenase-like lactoylglutathione lyase family enzyme
MTRSVSALIRGSIFVRDLDKAAAFYAALGFNEVYYEGMLDDPSASHIIGFANHGPLNIRIVKSGGPNYGMIGLFKIDDALNPEVVPMGTGAARVGEVALVFYVVSMAEALAKLRAAGATWSPEPSLFVMPHRAQQEVCIRDCDGVLLNLVENDIAEQELTGREGV